MESFHITSIILVNGDKSSELCTNFNIKQMVVNPSPPKTTETLPEKGRRERLELKRKRGNVPNGTRRERVNLLPGPLREEKEVFSF